MLEQLIKEWQEQLANETDTRKYRLIMLTIAFLQSVRVSGNEQQDSPIVKDGELKQ